ncbi:Uncharacterized protein NEOC95_001256 [Neochlamydia sp. AcF95]|nr:Uncharacterized protein [Neochlamydia sp. AcF95]
MMIEIDRKKVAFWQAAFINIFNVTCLAQEKMLDLDKDAR